MDRKKVIGLLRGVTSQLIQKPNVSQSNVANDTNDTGLHIAYKAFASL